jgi:ABC-type phosphate/phosphonate transport system permease subunit
LIAGAFGMADIIRRAMPPDFSKIDMVWWPALETIDLGIFGTVGGVIMALPLASAMSLFQHQLISLLLIVTFVIVIAAERLSALFRARLG